MTARLEDVPGPAGGTGMNAPHAARELYGDDLRLAVHQHLRAHPVGLTFRDIARALGLRYPSGGGGQRVLRMLQKMEYDGEARYVLAPARDGSSRKTQRWYAT